MPEDIMSSPIPHQAQINASQPTEQANSWVSQISDPELRGHAETKGWHKLDAAQAAAEAVKAHRAVEKVMGAPADQLLRIPRPDDAEATKAFWARLGATDKPEDFVFEGVKFDDPAWQSGWTDAIRKAAVEHNVPVAMAERIAKAAYDFADSKGTEQKAAVTVTREADRQELLREWGPETGPRFKAAQFIADKAMDQLGITPEQANALAESMGRLGVAKMFHRIGSMMQEDRFVAGEAPAGVGGVMTKDQAVSRRAELISNTDFRTRFHNGDQSARKEMDALTRIIAGVA